MKVKKQLQILSLSSWDFAGCGYFLSEAINQTTDHKSRAVAGRVSKLQFPRDIVVGSSAEIRDLWKRADVIHIHDGMDLPGNLPARPVVMTWHGSIYRFDIPYHSAQMSRLGWLETAATIDLTLHGPRWMPDCRPDLSKYVYKRKRRFRVCHAPTKRHFKSTDTVIQAMRGFRNFDLIEGVTWKECLRRKGKSDVLIDQFKLGYGCNAIEAWLMGIPVIANSAIPKVMRAIEHYGDGFPFVRCLDDAKSIREAVEKLQTDKTHYRDYVKRGAEYVERYHSYQAVASYAIDFYYEALERFMDRPAGVELIQHPELGRKQVRRRRMGRKASAMLQSNETVLLRYTGTARLNQTFFGDATNPPQRYEFGLASKPTGYVYDIDVPGMLAKREKGRVLFVREKK